MLRVLLLLAFVLVPAIASAGDRMLIFAAASQKDALEEIGQLYEKICECEIRYSFAATSTLARQIDAGANVDVFISANEAWADWLEIRGLTETSSRTVIAGNRLVIASSANTRDSFNILKRGRFAMADPISVPAGIYARQALEALGIWRSVRANAVFSENVRVALSSVKQGALLSGIVYQSDLKLVPELNAHYVFPEKTHRPIHYVAAGIKGSASAGGFVNFLKSEEAQEVFLRFGFLPVSATNQG